MQKTNHRTCAHQFLTDSKGKDAETVHAKCIYCGEKRVWHFSPSRKKKAISS